MAPESESLIKAPAEGARGQNLVGWRRRKNDKNAKKVRDFVRVKIWSIIPCNTCQENLEENGRKKMRALHWFERQKKRRRCQNGKMAGKNEEKMPMAKLPAKYF